MGRLLLLCLLAACGRIGFADQARGDATGLPDAARDGQGSGSGSASAITYVGAPVQRLGPMGSTDSFTLQAARAGDVLVFMLGCAGSQAPSGITISAPGWTFTRLSPMTTDPPAQIYAASFGAIAPDTAAVTASITWASSTCNRGKTEIADELANATLDVHAEASGTGNCTTTITTGAANEAVWAACYAATMATAPGTGFTMSASDGIGDFAEYKLTTDPASTPETVTITNPNGFVVVAATLAPR